MLAGEVSTLQQLAGIPGVPRLVGVCKDANFMRGIVMQPLGKVIEWEEWNSRITAEQPLHKLVGQLVHTLEMSHARGIINRDVRPGNVIVAGSNETQQLVSIDWGFAVKCPEGRGSVALVYEGTIGYASDSVWRQNIDTSGCG